MPGADPQWSAGLHGPIVDSLRRRDVRGVTRALEGHFTEVSDVLRRRLEATAAADHGDEHDPGEVQSGSRRKAAASPGRATGAR
jgi:hypothetical protein